MSLDVAALYDSHHAAVLRYVRRHLVGVDDAVIEDLVADVWERVVRSVPRYQDRGAPISAWLFSIARNLLTDHYRKWSPRDADGRHRRRARRITVHAFGAIEAFVTQVGTDRHVALIDARRGLAHLTDVQRQAVQARMVDGWSIRETARLIGRTEESVKQAQKNGLTKLRRLMEAA